MVGAYYANQVVEKLHRCHGSAQHFTPAHCPWTNGTVEVMMWSIRKTLGILMVEFKLSESDVPSILPLVQHALSHTPA